MKRILLTGCLGTRFEGEDHLIPKSMVSIVDRFHKKISISFTWEKIENSLKLVISDELFLIGISFFLIRQ